jgi:ferritin-like metal-binding protein YciE
MNNLEDLFDWWLDSIYATENRIEHLKTQKSFHIEFTAFVLRENDKNLEKFTESNKGCWSPPEK